MVGTLAAADELDLDLPDVPLPADARPIRVRGKLSFYLNDQFSFIFRPQSGRYIAVPRDPLQLQQLLDSPRRGPLKDSC